MSLRLGALHDALLKPGDAELARKAAEEVAGYERDMADMRSDLYLLKWMVGTNVVLTIGVLLRMFS
jgi:hypothetical protein